MILFLNGWKTITFISDEGHHSAFSMLYAIQRWKCRGHGEFLYSAYF